VTGLHTSAWRQPVAQASAPQNKRLEQAANTASATSLFH
jgi:hypothetical protein